MAPSFAPRSKARSSAVVVGLRAVSASSVTCRPNVPENPVLPCSTICQMSSEAPPRIHMSRSGKLWSMLTICMRSMMLVRAWGVIIQRS